MAKPKRPTSKRSTKPATKKASAGKKAAKKPAAKKATTKKAPPKKTTAKKVVAPKKVAKKPAAKKATAKKAAARKPAVTGKALAKKVAADARRSVEHEPHAFVEGRVSRDALAEEMAENAVRAMTTGEDEEGDREGETLVESGGPFQISSGSVEYARDDVAPNIPSAEPAGRPTTRNEPDDDEEEEES